MSNPFKNKLPNDGAQQGNVKGADIKSHRPVPSSYPTSNTKAAKAK